MRFLIITLSLLFVAQPVFAAKAKKATVKKVAAKKNKDVSLSTDIQFDNSMVNGRYQSADEALAVVEDEKTLNDLIGPRTQFKDRLKKSTTRR